MSPRWKRPTMVGLYQAPSYHRLTESKPRHQGLGDDRAEPLPAKPAARVVLADGCAEETMSRQSSLLSPPSLAACSLALASGELDRSDEHGARSWSSMTSDLTVDKARPVVLIRNSAMAALRWIRGDDRTGTEQDAANVGRCAICEEAAPAAYLPRDACRNLPGDEIVRLHQCVQAPRLPPLRLRRSVPGGVGCGTP